MNQTVFEAHGEELIACAGMTKAEFARRMGIQRQNVKSLFRSPKLETVYKVAQVLNLPVGYLIGYVDPIDYDEEPFSSMIREQNIQGMDDSDAAESLVIQPEDIPTGDSAEDRKVRQQLILSYYEQWKKTHPELCVFNYSLNDCICVKHISIEETASHASLSYLSTLAVLQLDAILHNAKLVDDTPIKKGTKNQMQFSRVLLMRYNLIGIGSVRLTVGVRRSDNSKVQYCATAIDSCV